MRKQKCRKRGCTGKRIITYTYIPSEKEKITDRTSIH